MNKYEKPLPSRWILSLQLCAVLFFLYSCQNQLLPEPSIIVGQDTNQTTQLSTWGPPQNLTATQGEKQEITLTWSAVKSAIRYYIYEAASPYDKFVQIGETTDATPSFTMKVEAGTDMYYKVTAVDQNEKETGFSAIQRATSLAKPLISEISSEDSSVTVYWYMGNASAYQQYVRYTIICADSKGTEIARTSVNGADTTSTYATFSGLTPNTDYVYTVEAFLVTAQDKTEQSDAIDATTARRLRPKPPENLTATQGKSRSEVTLSFTLPDFVDVAVSSGVYEQHPLYFKIFRREKAQDGEQMAEYVPICTYLGYLPDDETTGKKNFGIAEYTPGATVTYTDTAGLTRGVVYEYKVQAFADDTSRQITSDLSCAETYGWLIAPISLRTRDYNATTDSEETPTAFVSAELKFTLNFDAMGKMDEYAFILEESKSPLLDESGDVTTTETKYMIFSTIDEMNEYVREYDIAKENSGNEGYYKYSIYLVPADSIKDTSEELDKDAVVGQALDMASAIGQALVTRSLEQPKIEFFSVTSGYADKIVIQWKYNDTYKYTLDYRENGEDFTVEDFELEVAFLGKENGATISYDHPAEPGTTREYVLYATTTMKKGTDEKPITGSTLGMPSPYAGTPAYDSVSVHWEETKGAESYTISAAYTDANVANKHSIPPSESLPSTSSEYTFSLPAGYNDAKVSGLPIQVTLTASTSVKQTKIELDADGKYGEPVTEDVTADDGSAATASLSATATVRTVGPALIGAKAVQSQYEDKISLSWSKAEGAEAYAVIRNSFHIAPGGTDEFQSTETYIVDVSDATPSVTQSGGMDDISGAVTVTVSTDGDMFTLYDNQKDQTDSTSGWQKSQSQISWGCPYDYIVVPLVSADDTPEYDYEQPSNVTLNGTTISSLSATRGSTMGYGWNVTATKGWQTSGLSGENTSAVNSTIRIEWENPSISVKAPDSYSVFRRVEGTSEWKELAANVKEMYYDDTPPQPDNGYLATVYEYAIGINNTTDPTKNAAFIAFCDEKKDSVFMDEKAAAGFVLPQPQITSASREALENNAERIEWPAAKVGGENNRMIDGYVIEVLNHNISDEWHQIAEIKHSTAGATATYTQLVDNSGGLLKVLRDYKHYFRIRSFREHEGKRTLSPAPDYTWSDGAENNYVMWGGRMITIEEFTKAALIGMSTGMYKARGTEGCNDDGNDIAGLSSDSTYNIATDFTVHLEYNNYVASHMPKSNAGEVSTVTITGYLKARGGLAGAYQTHYWTESPMTVYYYGIPGTIQFNGENSKGGDTVTRTEGTIDVTWAGQSVRYDMGNNPPFTLPFAVKGGYLNDTEEWK